MRSFTMALLLALGWSATFTANADTGQAITPIKNTIIHTMELAKKRARIKRKLRKIRVGGPQRRRR